MKTLSITFFLLFVFASVLNAQSIKLMDESEKLDITGDTVTVQYHPGTDHGWTEISIYIHAKNISNNSIEMGVKKIEFNIQPDEYHSFCFAGNCFTNSQIVSPYTDIVPAGSTDSSFSGHYRFDDIQHTPTISLVAYTFYNAKNISDSSIVYVKYNTMPISGIEEFSKDYSYLVQALPNPANDNISFNYQVKKSGNSKVMLVISNILGSKIMEKQLTEYKGTISLETDKWLPGIYFYSIMVGNNTEKTDKFIIVH